MAKRRKSKAPSASEKRRQAARRAELREAKKRAEKALQRKRSAAAKKGWETRKAKSVPKKTTAQRATQKSAKPRKIVTAKPKRFARSPDQRKRRIRYVQEEIKKRHPGGKARATRAIRRLTKVHVDRLMRSAEHQTPWQAWQDEAADDDNRDEEGNNPFWYHA